MKPYGRLKKIMGCGDWKEDFRIRINHKKVGNWWEDMDTTIPRATMKQLIKKEINEMTR